jgi:hypothetical protein
MKSSFIRVQKSVRHHTRWLVVYGLLCLVASCQPNSPLETQDPDPNDDLSIAEAKAWFTDYLASPANARTSADDGFVKNAYWEYAFEHRFSTKNKVVVVPLLHFKRGQMSGFKQLWVYKDNKKKTTMRVMEYFHAESGKGKVLTLKDFTGYMLVKDWDDTFLGGFELKNNQFVGALSKSSKNGRTSGYVCAIGQSCRSVRVGHAEDPSGGYQYWSCVTDIVCTWSELMADDGSNSGGSPPHQDGGVSGIDWYSYYHTNYEGSGKPENAINIQKYLDCFTFNSSSTYKVGIYVDQPVVNSRAYINTNLPTRRCGHTYVMLEQNQNGLITRRIAGFYATGDPRPWNPIQTSVWGNDSNSAFDVGVVVNLGNNYQAFGSFAGTLIQMGGQYDLNNYNCTDAALQAFNAIGIHFPDTQGYWYVGGGTNPSDLAEDLRNWGELDSRMTKYSNGGISPTNARNCN